MLHLSLGGGHGRLLRGPRHGVESCLLGPQVHQHEADVGLVGGDGGHAGVEVHVVVDGQVIVAVGGAADISLAEDGVPVAVLEFSIVVQLGDDQVGRVELVDPLGHILFLVVGALPGDGVDQDGPVDVLAVPPANPVGDGGGHPVGDAVVVDLKGDVVEHFRGIAEAEISVDIPEKILAGGVLHAALQPDQVRLLGHHVHGDVGWQAGALVEQPLDGVSVHQGGHPVGGSLVIDLGVIVRHLKLGDQLGHLPQLPVPQAGGGIPVHHRNVGHVDLGDVR